MREEGSLQYSISDKIVFVRGLLNNRMQTSLDKVHLLKIALSFD